MKFIDSVDITVIAGNGGDGCISFQKRTGSCFYRKPDGSNGGDGGSVWLLSDSNIKNLNYFNYNRIFKAGDGSTGSNRNRTGKKGKDIIIKVPLGTIVRCKSTNKLLGDMLNRYDNPLMVAKGGYHGLGNRSFKYVQHPIYKNKKSNIFLKSKGQVGEMQHLSLDLFLMADVGIFGLPNSGKSSFLRKVSRAKPKIADYPFTTLEPQLGTVNMDNYNSDNRFVIADIPGIIRGASKGKGLGIQFLKHLKRCRMLLHFVDINFVDDFSRLIKNILDLEQELSVYDYQLINKTRWLIFNKIDLLDKYELKKRIDTIMQFLKWEGRYYLISVTHDINISVLCYDIMSFIKDISKSKKRRR